MHFRCKCLAYLEIKEKNKIFIINKTKLEMSNKSAIKASYSFKKFLKLLLCFVYNTRANICSFVHLVFIVISQKKTGKSIIKEEFGEEKNTHTNKRKQLALVGKLIQLIGFSEQKAISLSKSRVL